MADISISYHSNYECLSNWLLHVLIFNPLLPIAHKSARIDKISILKFKGIIKKFHMSVATMSR